MTPFPRSRCPIVNALDLFGDRWTLVVVRDLVRGKTRFGELLESGEHIATNVLADRLAQLEAAGFLERTPYQRHPPRFAYTLTDKGRGLLPVLQELCRWGNRFIPGTVEPPASFMRARQRR